jgi:ATP-dependent DNA helicase RecQ
MRFAEGGSCRHDAVLRYFGDEKETLSGCGNCDVCERLASGAAMENAESEEEVTLIVRKALSAIARIHGRFGLGAAVALLRGQADARLSATGLNATPTFGVLADRSEVWLTKLLRRCVTAGWVDFAGGDRPLAILTETGTAVMRGERAARLLLPPEKSGLPRASGSENSARDFVVRKNGNDRAGSADELAMDDAAMARFEALRIHRLNTAQAEGVPSYVVASDRSLREIAVLNPTRPEDLILAHGIGEAKVNKYGEGFLRVLHALEDSALQETASQDPNL